MTIKNQTVIKEEIMIDKEEVIIKKMWDKEREEFGDSIISEGQSIDILIDFIKSKKLSKELSIYYLKTIKECYE
jgi:hypothetical protein